mmetsp:Transcript_4749/g.6530  ORF Transcript_4749/g.6530 Transcript_4749/m.6530 type:complete len:105 (-) Transcript_4749:212-526(-)
MPWLWAEMPPWRSKPSQEPSFTSMARLYKCYRLRLLRPKQLQLPPNSLLFTLILSISLQAIIHCHLHTQSKSKGERNNDSVYISFQLIQYSSIPSHPIHSFIIV